MTAKSKGKKTQAHQGSAGGSASTGGAQYSTAVAAWAAVKMLAGAGASLDWDVPVGTSIQCVECESATAIDDLVLTLVPEGRVFIQIKHGLRFDSEFTKALDQLIRQYLAPGFRSQRDRLVILTDDTATGTLRNDLVLVLSRCRKLPADRPLADEAGKSTATKQAWRDLFDRINERWEAATRGTAPIGSRPTDAQLRDFLDCMYLTVRDPASGREQDHAVELLKRHVDEASAQAVWNTLNCTIMTHAVLRTPVDRPLLWAKLEQEGFAFSVRRITLGDREAYLHELLKAMTKGVLEKEASLNRYGAAQYVERAALDAPFARFLSDDRPLMVVVGASGNGKSSWCLEQSRTQTERPILLIQGISLRENDESIVHTIYRLLKEYTDTSGGKLPAQHEVLEWLAHARLLVIVDGLDRAPVPFGPNLQRWLENTATWLAGKPMKLVLCSRDESLSGAEHFLKGLTSLIFPQRDSEPYFVLGDFDDDEAKQAAARLGKPWLAKYRHPSLMAFAGALTIAEGDAAVPSSLVIERYVDHRINQIQLQSGVLKASLDDFVDRIAAALAQSETGQLPRREIASLAQDDRHSFEALVRGNLLRHLGEWARVEPDEVSESLASRKTDIARAIAAVGSHLRHPLKLGALRTAIGAQARRSRSSAVAALTQLIDAFEATSNRLVRAFAASVFLEIAPGDDALGDELFALASRLLSDWDIPNIALRMPRFDALLALANSPQWSPMQRVELLWSLAGGESCFSWREKDWQRQQRLSSVQDNEPSWLCAMLGAIKTDPQQALPFLRERFESTRPLEGGDEANVGSVARGLFFLSSDTLLEPALRLLLDASGEMVDRVLRSVVREYSERTIDWLLQHTPGALSDNDLLRLVCELPYRLPVAGPAAEFLRRIAADTPSKPLQLRSLAVLADSGDEAAALRILDEPTIASEHCFSLAAFALEPFARLLDLLLDAVLSGKVQPPRFIDMAIHVPENDDGEYAALLIHALGRWLDRQPGDAQHVGRAAELLLYPCFKMNTAPAGIENLIGRILATQSAAAIRPLIYAALPIGVINRQTPAGMRLQRAIAEQLATAVTDLPNRAELVRLSIQEIEDPSFAVHLLCKMSLTVPGDDPLDHIPPYELDDSSQPNATAIVEEVRKARSSSSTLP